MAQNAIISLINKYVDVLKENGIVFDKVILFGSSVNSEPGEWGDIDLAVISPQFTSDIYDILIFLAKLAYNVDPRLEIHPISSYEFENESWKTIIHEIKTTGLEIAA